MRFTPLTLVATFASTWHSLQLKQTAPQQVSEERGLYAVVSLLSLTTASNENTAKKSLKLGFLSLRMDLIQTFHGLICHKHLVSSSFQLLRPA